MEGIRSTGYGRLRHPNPHRPHSTQAHLRCAATCLTCLTSESSAAIIELRARSEFESNALIMATSSVGMLFVLI